MKIKFSLLIVVLLISSSSLISRIKENININNIKTPRNKIKSVSKLIDFNFNNENLSEIINHVASEFKVNIILPQGPDAIKQKITFQPEDGSKVTLKEAWQLMNMFLELSGYALSIQGKFYIIIKKETDKTGRSQYPLFIGVNPDSLPNTDQRIQYVYFLSNIKVPENSDNDPLSKLLKETLSDNSTIIYDSKSNAIILSDKASNISGAMRIIVEFDKSGFNETLEVIRLYNSSASTVAKILQELAKAAQKDDEKSPFISQTSPMETSTAFPKGIKIVGYTPGNSLIISGRQTAVNRIKEFVNKYIDVPQKTGQSILHVYDLQYLDAESFAPILSEIVKTSIKGAQSEGAASGLGPERYFEGPPIVVAEGLIKVTPEQGITGQGFRTFTGVKLEGKASGSLAEAVLRGGNRIIIAALNEDWEVIKSLIQQLDRPEPQVILEVLTVSVNIIKDKLLGATTRRRRGECFCPDKDRVEFLSSQLSTTNNVLCTDENCTDLNTLATDLLQLANNNNPASIGRLFANDAGLTLISFKDSVKDKVWSILAALDNLTETKVLNHPFLVTTNNRPAQVAISEIRRGQGEAVGTESGVVTIPFIDITASNLMQFIPRIASADRLSLQLKIILSEFTDPLNVNNFTRFNRVIETNANMRTSQVLAIGGLGRTDETEVSRKTPILGLIPFIGQFFRFNRDRTAQDNLLILISPTIVNPKRRKGLDLYTTDKIRSVRKKFDQSIFVTDKQPILKWYFGENSESDEALQEFLSDTKNAPEFVELLSKKELTETGLVRPEKKAVQTVIDDPLEKERKLKEVLAYADNPMLSVEQA